MLYHHPISMPSISLYTLHLQSLHLLYLYQLSTLLSAHKQCCLNVLNVNFMLLWQISITILIKYTSDFLFSPRSNLQVVGNKLPKMVKFMKPGIRMKAFKINIKYLLLLAYNLFELFKRDLFFILIKVEAFENVGSILLHKISNVTCELELRFNMIRHRGQRPDSSV